MFFENPFFEPATNWLIAWVGELDHDGLDAYLDEPGHAADNEPISKFSKDLGTWYNHDFIWSQAAPNRVSAQEICGLNGIEDDLIDEIVQRTNDEVRCLVILWNAKQISAGSRDFADGKLKCLGSWPHQSPLAD